MLLAALLLLGACSFLVRPDPAAADDGCWLRVAHLSPDTPAADITLAPAGSTTTAGQEPGLTYGAVSPWHRLAPGAYTVAVRAKGAAASTAPVLSVRIDLVSGAARTVALVGRFADLRLSVQDEDLSPPSPGQARARVVDAASAGSLGVSVVGGPVLATGLRLADSGRPTELPGGPAMLAVTTAGAAPQHVPVDLAAGSVTTLLVLDGTDGGLAVRPVVDTSGLSAVPAGPVQAGGGGTAQGFPLRLLAAVVAGLAGTLLLSTFRPRRRRP